jgi:hypothetical protein
VEVKLEIYVDKRTAHTLNSGKDKLYDILVLHLLGGKDIFITVHVIFYVVIFLDLGFGFRFVYSSAHTNTVFR